MKTITSFTIKTAWFMVVLLLLRTSGFAQDVKNDYQTRTSVELSFAPIKNLKLNLIPEFRFDDSFSLDKYLIEGEAVYKPIKYLSLGATYRFVGNLRNTKETEYLNRYAFSATAKKKFNRFEPAFRVRYSNYADDDVSNEEFLRYKASVKYDIKGSKITPFLSVEAFQEMTDVQLHKIRYSAGVNYKLFKKNFIGIGYHLDSFQNENKNRHIFSIGYKMKF